MFKKTLTLILLLFCFTIWSQSVQPIKTKWTTIDYNGVPTIIIPTFGTYTYVIKQDDAIVNSNQVTQSGLAVTKTVIQLPSDGIYSIEITPTSTNFKFYFYEGIETVDKFFLEKIRNSLVELSDWGNSVWNPNLNYMFQGCAKLNVVATNAPNLTGVKTLVGMFQGAELLSTDLNNWDVSSVTSLSRMFYRAINFNGNISNWNVSNVTDMGSTFAYAEKFNQSLNNWDVSNVVDMSLMFYGAKIFNGDISNWNTAKVKNMSSMFRSAPSFNGNISTWNVSNVEDMSLMFRSASVFNQNLNNWDVAKVKNMQAMFDNAQRFNQPINNWNTTSVNNIASMFVNANAFNQDISALNYNNVANATSFLDKSGLSCLNYAKLLNALAFKNDVKSGVSFGALGITYGDYGLIARNELVTAKNWTITGDVLVSDCDADLFLDDDGTGGGDDDGTGGGDDDGTGGGDDDGTGGGDDDGTGGGDDDGTGGGDDDGTGGGDDVIIEEPTKSNEVHVFPNPITDLLNVQSDRKVNSVQIYGLDGKTIYSGSASQIPMSNFTSGFYFLKIYMEDGEILEKKIIKN